MNLKPIDNLPSRKNRNMKPNNNRLQSIIMDFYDFDLDYAEVLFDNGEYANSYSMYSGLQKAVRSLDVPVEVQMIQGGVYLRRTD